MPYSLPVAVKDYEANIDVMLHVVGSASVCACLSTLLDCLFLPYMLSFVHCGLNHESMLTLS